jgi:tetratricopeptide (TPR) repeat protein
MLQMRRATALKQPGPPIADLTLIAKRLGWAYEQAGQLAKAESLYRETLETIRQRQKEASHEYIDFRPLNLVFETRLNDWQKEVSSEYVDFRAALGGILLQERKYAEAESLLRECLTFREQNQPVDWETFQTKSSLGGSLLGQKNYAEAEPLLLAGYAGIQQCKIKLDAPRFKSSLNLAIARLVQLYEASGEPGKATIWRARMELTDLPADVFARP